MPDSDTTDEQGPWTILKILKWTTDFLDRCGAESPRASAEVLLAHALGIRRIDLYLRFDQPLNAEELTCFRQFVKRRSKGEPVAYILGCKEFWSLDFKVNQDVLIPRPETEVLVEAAIHCLRQGNFGPNPNVLELGTGSGIISVAMAHDYPDAGYVASDLSIKAVLMARENASYHLTQGKIAFFAGRWLEAIRKPRGGFALVVSNPPYICNAEIDQLAREIRYYEPKLALAGGSDGLRDIGHLISRAPDYLSPAGWLLIEIGYDQKSAVESLAAESGAYSSIDYKKDYGGHDRVALLRCAD